MVLFIRFPVLSATFSLEDFPQIGFASMTMNFKVEFTERREDRAFGFPVLRSFHGSIRRRSCYLTALGGLALGLDAAAVFNI